MNDRSARKTVARLPVTVIVPTRNEEKNIGDCLRSVTWADEVYVVDSHSSDSTVEIAEQLGARVVQFRYDGGWPKKKNWALKNLPIRSDWILILDADERVDEALREEISAAIDRSDIDGYYIRWKFIFLGRWMKHCWRHGWMLRLLRKGTGEYEDLGMRSEGGWDNEVHENIVVNGRTAKLKSWLVHNSNQSLSDWVKKQNDFSDWNAKRRIYQNAKVNCDFIRVISEDPLMRRKALKSIFLKLPFKSTLLFLYLYIFKLGILDGKPGLFFCLLRSNHELLINAKIYEMRNSKNSDVP